MSDPMTPDMQAAALQGLANNPIGQLYATAYQAGEHAGAKTLGETTAVQAYGIGYQDGATLSMIVRDLMDAASYSYQPDGPLPEQARECGQLIRDIRAMHDDLSTRIHIDSDRHEAEVQRLTDLVDELRKQLTGANRRIEQLGNTLTLHGSHPGCITCEANGQACTIHGEPVNRSVATTQTKP